MWKPPPGNELRQAKRPRELKRYAGFFVIPSAENPANFEAHPALSRPFTPAPESMPAVWAVEVLPPQGRKHLSDLLHLPLPGLLLTNLISRAILLGQKII